MIIDCHGHYTTAPKALEDWRNRQVAALGNPADMPKVADLVISDDDLRETIEKNQLKKMRERGSDLTDRKSTRLNSSHVSESRMPSSA